MPDLRGGIGQSKRINDNLESPASLVPTAWHGAASRGRGRGRGRGRRGMNTDDNCKLVGPGARGRGCTEINLPVRQIDEKSAERLVAVEEEGSTSSLPERVQLGNSPVYKLDRKLCKGGFVQVYVGRGISGGSGCSGPDALNLD